MITNHDPTNHIIELDANTFDPAQPPTPDQAEDLLNETENLISELALAVDIATIGYINVTDITYQHDSWYIEYQPN